MHHKRLLGMYHKRLFVMQTQAHHETGASYSYKKQAHHTHVKRDTEALKSKHKLGA
jgi:hypothetical protein